MTLNIHARYHADDNRRQRRSRFFRYPYIALITAIAGAFTTVEGVSWLVASPLSWQSTTLFVFRTASLIWFAFDPRLGAYAVVLAQCADFVVPQTTPVSMMFTALLIVGASAYLSIWRAAVLAGLLVCGSALNMVLLPTAFMSGGGMISYALLTLISMLVGVLTRKGLHRQEQKILNISALSNNTIAQHLHDYTTNDMNDIIMLSDAIMDTPSATDHAESIHRIREIAANALTQTRTAISSLEQARTPIAPVPRLECAGQPPSNLQERVSDLLDEQQELLESLGFTGTVIMPSPLPASHDADGRLLLGLLRELFGNIAHHAAPRQGYTLAICGSDRCCDISLADTPVTVQTTGIRRKAKNDDLPKGMRSGLRRYERAIAERHGEWEITAKPDSWSLHATIIWS